MLFDKNYFEAREAAVKWLRRDPSRQNYEEGVALLERLKFKPLLAHRLRMGTGNPMMHRFLVQALTDGVNVYRNPTSPRFADTIPAEVEEATSGTMPPPPSPQTEQAAVPSTVQSSVQSDRAVSSFPSTVRTIMKWYSDAYRRRDRLHREMRALGESNDPTTMARRKALSDRINALTDYMDEVYPLRESYDTLKQIPSTEDIDAIGSFDMWSVRHSMADKESSTEAPAPASFRLKDEDFSKMSLAELRKRRSSIRTMLVRKGNQLLYQSDSKQEKENPMPLCPERTKIEKQVEGLKQKLYLVIKAISEFG